MHATTARPTLLSAAKNFMRKSAGTAVLAIAPLAAVNLAPEAQAQTIFGQPSGGSLTQGGGANSSLGHFSGGGATSSSYLVNGVRLNRDMIYATHTTGSISGGSLAIGLGDMSSISPGLALGSSVDYTYNFDVTKEAGITFLGWDLQIQLTDGSVGADTFIFASNNSGITGNQAGSGTFTSSSLALAETYEVTLLVYFNAVGSSQHLTIGMSGGSQGVTLNATAIPEPSTYAAIFGLGALGFVIVRRTRRPVA